jgi:hypothetical protein
MSAPERIWANEGLEWHSFDCSDVKSGWTHPYILATPEALAASPEVAKLVAEAEARGMERAAEMFAEMWRENDGYRIAKIRAEAAAIRSAEGETT